MTPSSPPASNASASTAADTGDSPPIPSPCTQVCRIDASSGWCEGCGRTLAEIAAWGEMSEAQKASVWLALKARRRDLR